MASIKIILERMSKMRKTERNFTNKVLESKRGDVQAVKSKIKRSVMATAFLFAATMPLSMAVPVENVQAAVVEQKQVKKVNQKVKTNTSKTNKTTISSKVTSSTMIKAYKKYLRKNVSNKKYYAIVNIGDNNAPVLLIGTRGAGNDKTGRHYTGCQIYYYKNGKAVKMDTFREGGRWLLLSRKNGQNYLTNGGSDFSIRICVKNGNLYSYQYYNNHNWKKNPENKWATSIVKVNSRIIKNMGYLDGTIYRKHTGYYTYLKNPEISFIRNVK